LVNAIKPADTADASDPYVLESDGTILEVGSKLKFFNIGLEKIEERVWGGYYLTPEQFIFDLSQIVSDQKNTGDRDKVVKVWLCCYMTNTRRESWRLT
jgi:hypothetical protein